METPYEQSLRVAGELGKRCNGYGRQSGRSAVCLARARLDFQTLRDMGRVTRDQWEAVTQKLDDTTTGSEDEARLPVYVPMFPEVDDVKRTA